MNSFFKISLVANNSFKNGPIPASFSFIFVFCLLDTIQIQIDKSINGVLGTRTRGDIMESADKLTELWRHPIIN